MAITFIDGGSKKVEHIVVGLYGGASIGKTSLALTAAKPVLFDFDGKSHKAPNRAGIPTNFVTKWADVAQLTPADLRPFETVIIDTVGAALDFLSIDIAEREPKARRASGGLSQNGYGLLRLRFDQWMNNIYLAEKDVVLVAHGVEEQRGDDTVVHRIIATGSSRNKVYQVCDILGQLLLAPDGKRLLTFDPSHDSLRKNVGLPTFTVQQPSEAPHGLATVIAQAKDLMNHHMAKQTDEHARLAALRYSFEQFSTVAQFNEMAEEMRTSKASAVEKRILREVGESKGFALNKNKKFEEQSGTLM